ncbi:MAG: HypC/HybG/HupF family hydrogenase formation chaperone [Sandaracinaceae bacterium]|nr:HypC/HybG/HupF family hydrogenase formation chaperone [Sandaracinaceae bacterium]
MCLAVPGRVVATFEEHAMRMARVSFGGVERAVCLETLPEVREGDYVLVHVGFAIARIDEAEAARLLRELEALDGTA